MVAQEGHFEIACAFIRDAFDRGSATPKNQSSHSVRIFSLKPVIRQR
jgi:hypothetical protein